MHLFSIPTEIIDAIFYEAIVRVRSEISQVVQLRHVNRQFKYWVDETVFRHRYLDHIFRFQRNRICPPPWRRHHPIRESFPYLHSYLMYRVTEAPSKSMLGFIRRTAQAFDGPGSELERISSLLCLAAEASLIDLLSHPIHYLYTENDDLWKAVDTLVAAVYLGRKDYVERLSAGDLKHLLYPKNCTELRTSLLFGSVLEAAAMQGELEMIRLIISHEPPHPERHLMTAPTDILLLNCAHNNRDPSRHQAVFNFVLDEVMLNPSIVPYRYPYSPYFEELFYSASFPTNFERAATALEHLCTSDTIDPQQLLLRSAKKGQVEMVRYFLDKGVPLNTERSDLTPIMCTIEGGNEMLLRMLLDSGADPNYETTNNNTALMIAAWCGWVKGVNILLDLGVDPNQGYPPPLVLAAFNNRARVFQVLRARGATLNTPDTRAFVAWAGSQEPIPWMESVLEDEGISQDPGEHYYPRHTGCREYAVLFSPW